MKRIAILVAVLLFLPAQSLAGDLDRQVESRWTGSWVVTRLETSSNCSGEPTPNRVSGRLVKSGGRHRFSAGELARVTGVDFKSSRIRFLLSLTEPILLSRSEGPFTLIREVACEVDLEVEIPKDVSRSKNPGSFDRHLSWVLGRFGSAEEAKQSSAWNRRLKDPYPANYETTLIEYAVWKLEKLNEGPRSRFDEALEKMRKSAMRVGDNPAYLAGFSEGAKAARSASFGPCADLIDLKLEEPSRAAERAYPKKGKGRLRESRAGYEDGYLMVYGVEFLRRLQGCFVSPESVKPILARADR
jgi:hypothetical protein